MNPAPTPKPAFNPWPYGIGGFLLCFLLCVISVAILASRQRTDLVRADYYEEELRFQKQIDRVNRTRPIKSEISVRVIKASRKIALELPAEFTDHDTTGTIQFYRPSDARLDRQVPLAVDGNGRQSLDATELQPGLWRLRVSWKTGGSEYFHDSSLVIPSEHAANQTAATL